MSEKGIVLKIGGSLLFNDDLTMNLSRIKEFSDFIQHNADLLECVVIGGGKIARSYIDTHRQLQENQAFEDLLGIKVSRLNALFISSLVGNSLAYQGVPESVEELLRIKSLNPEMIVFLGGLEVGQSTTSVACEITEAINASKLLIGTDVDGIYDKDPEKFKDAKKLDVISIPEIRTILGLNGHENQMAGEYRILDNISLSIIARSKLSVQIAKGNVKALQKAIDGEKVGTIIQS
ncbi:MAG: UMP kinase [Promethearchaeota archaeon]